MPDMSGMRLLVALILSAGVVSSAAGQADVPPTSSGSDEAEALHSEKDTHLWKHLELKRQFTERGTPEESSRTILRLDATPDTFLSLIRLDLPLVDKKNGDAMSPRLGDIKLKFESRSVVVDESRLIPSLEVTFPTADSATVGNGKYQLGPGIELWLPVWASGQAGTARTWDISLKPLVRQVFSVAGRQDFKDLNYTKLEPSLKIAWRRKLALSLTPKMVFDWEQGGTSGAVFELEPAWNITRRLRLKLTLGAELWGRGVPTTYGRKIETALRFNF